MITRLEARLIAEAISIVLPPPINEEFLTIDECADYLKMKKSTLLRNKDIPRIRFNGRLIFPKSKLIKYIYGLGGVD